MEKAAIYCRLSEEDRNKRSETDDSGSIRNQKAMLRQYADTQGWQVYDIYSDDNYTGSDRNRPEFIRLLRDAEAGCFDIVLCKSQSRFTRELELVERYIHGLFPLWGIRFVSLVDNADTANRGNKKSRQINGLVNEWYLEDMSENIRSVLTSRRKSGLHIGAFALYGYKKDPDRKGHLLIDPEAAAVVREVFALFARGYGKTAIARMLNDRGIPNPTEYKRQKGLRYAPPAGKTGTLWKYPAIADMLVNEIYIGNMVQGRYGSVSYKTKQNKPRPKSEWYIVKNTHEPIIDRALWDQVQAMVAARAKPFGSGSVGLFAQKARCAGCGAVLRSSKSHGRHYLQCSSRYASKDACAGAFISVDRLEQMVIHELNALSDRWLDRAALARPIDPARSMASQKSHWQKTCDGLRRQLESSRACLRALYADKVRGVVSEADYMAMAEGFSAERARLEARLVEADRRLAALQPPPEEPPQASAGYPTHVEHLTRPMVEILIDHIVVGRRIPGTRHVPIEIHWNF